MLVPLIYFSLFSSSPRDACGSLDLSQNERESFNGIKTFAQVYMSALSESMPKGVQSTS